MIFDVFRQQNQLQMRILITVIFLFCAIYSTIAQSHAIKEISGIITYLNRPLEDVNIIIKSTSKGTSSTTSAGSWLMARHLARSRAPSELGRGLPPFPSSLPLFSILKLSPSSF